MLYDPRGRPIPETDAPPARPVRPGAWIDWDAHDHSALSHVSRGLTPETVDSIMRAADSGDTPRMCALAEQIDDRSFAIGAALDTRRAAIAATPWRLEPADDSSRAEEIAKAAEQMLRGTHPGNDLLTFGQMVQLELGSALLPGFAAPEIVWAKGGAAVLGYNSVPQKFYTFTADGRTPRLLANDQPDGIPLEPGKFVLHWHRAKGGSPTRGGLIRACAWLRCFESVNLKDLLRFIERYGMPFLVAKVDEQSWKTERSVLRAIVRNFGPDGGAVLSRSTELELLAAANNPGDVYFRLLEYLEKATEKLILGQTATSGEGGWSNSGAQHLVRMDIRDSDCAQIAETVYARILVPWTRWNYGPEAPVPRQVYEIEEAKNTQAEATVVKTLDEAGWELDPEQVEANTGYRVTRRAAAAPPANSAALSLDDSRGFFKMLANVLQDNDTYRAQAAALAADSATDDDIPDRIAKSALARARKASVAMFADLQDRLDEIAGIEDAVAFERACAALSADLPGMVGDDSTEQLEQIVGETIYGAAASGMAERLNELERRL
jgi:phage gp29-like protein